jgi:hypothetical protein
MAHLKWSGSARHGSDKIEQGTAALVDRFAVGPFRRSLMAVRRGSESRRVRRPARRPPPRIRSGSASRPACSRAGRDLGSPCQSPCGTARATASKAVKDLPSSAAPNAANRQPTHSGVRAQRHGRGLREWDTAYSPRSGSSEWTMKGHVAGNG